MANANQQRFWLLHRAAHWRELEPGAGDLHYDEERRTLRLASRSARTWPDDEAASMARTEIAPQAVDREGHRAFWDGDAGAVVGTGAFPGTRALYLPAAGIVPTDLAMGHDDVLYIAQPGAVAMRDTRSRWAPRLLEAPGFLPWRLAPCSDGGVWVLDRDNGRLGRVVGQPLPIRPSFEYSPGVFRPDPEDADPPRIRVIDGEPWPVGETPVALACSADGTVGVLLWPNEGDARLRRFDHAGRPLDAVVLAGVEHPYSLAWVGEHRVAVLLPDVPEAPVFELPATGSSARVAGNRYPLPDHSGGPFLKGPADPARYPVVNGSRSLRRLSLPSLVRAAVAVNGEAGQMDSGEAGFAWHRLQLEAVIPEHCGLRARLAATDEPEMPPVDDTGVWFEHRIGPSEKVPGVPTAVWQSSGSELPFHPGMLPCAPVPGIAGVFTVLIQRSGRRVRTLRGRFLWIRLDFTGDGRTTPEMAALRAYGPRFSYRDTYLPELYRENLFGDQANEHGPATPADFLERFLDNMEGELTTIEDRVAGAHLLTHPRRVPEESLEWLASWVGLAFDPAWPPESRRAMIASSAELRRRRGTVQGLTLAIDLLTDGAVRRGRAVVIEDFRLRRTFATILGADLEDADDPLLGGVTESGNSFVGDSLFIGDESRREFLALFAPGVATGSRDDAAVRDLFDRLAHRVTVLVHEESSAGEAGLIARILDRELPAHVEGRVLRASHPLLVGVASLVGVDSYLRAPTPPDVVVVGRTRIGIADRVRNPASLDPRIDGGPHSPLGGVATASLRGGSPREGESFDLDGGRSAPAPGNRLASFAWEMDDDTPPTPRP